MLDEELDAYEEHMNARHGIRMECCGCRMFGTSHEMMEDDNGNVHHPECLGRSVASQTAQTARVIYLVQPAQEEEYVPEFAFGAVRVVA